mmetsp:Transcript_80570/g.224173  ORF Transcript_80570/g.224173 Transcript_80570/m.224173 type:complete len:259 (-) Transcript_80570:275-1051(-)
MFYAFAVIVALCARAAHGGAHLVRREGENGALVIRDASLGVNALVYNASASAEPEAAPHDRRQRRPRDRPPPYRRMSSHLGHAALAAERTSKCDPKICTTGKIRVCGGKDKDCSEKRKCLSKGEKAGDGKFKITLADCDSATGFDYKCKEDGQNFRECSIYVSGARDCIIATNIPEVAIMKCPTTFDQDDPIYFRWELESQAAKTQIRQLKVVLKYKYCITNTGTLAPAKCFQEGGQLAGLEATNTHFVFVQSDTQTS